jgi:hypothetical protein
MKTVKGKTKGYKQVRKAWKINPLERVKQSKKQYSRASFKTGGRA